MTERVLSGSAPDSAVACLRVGGVLYRLLVLVLAVAYGATLSQIPSEQFKDFANYLAYAEESWPRFLALFEQGVLETFANEPAWLLINAALGAFLSPEAVVRTFIFASGTLVAGLILWNRPRQFFWLLLFLMSPLVLKNHLVHLRQGAAISLFLLGWFTPNRFFRCILVGLAPFIHASFFFVLLVLSATRSMVYIRLGHDLRTLVVVVMGVLVAVGLGWLAAMLGARQAHRYDFATADVSGLGFIFWLGILTLMGMEGWRFLRDHAFETGIIAFYLATYWLVEVTARIFESGLLLVLLAGLALTGWRRAGFLSAIVFYVGVMWLMRMDQPAMGFGIE